MLGFWYPLGEDGGFLEAVPVGTQGQLYFLVSTECVQGTWTSDCLCASSFALALLCMDVGKAGPGALSRGHLEMAGPWGLVN